MTKTIQVGGEEMTIRASALIPRLYRYHFNRDIIEDMMKLDKALKKNQEEGTQFSAVDLTIFENVAWLFLKNGGNDVKNTPDEWLNSVEGVFSVYEILPEIIDLWRLNLQTTATPKKK